MKIKCILEILSTNKPPLYEGQLIKFHIDQYSDHKNVLGLCKDINGYDLENWHGQELYILSNDKIEINDWVFNTSELSKGIGKVYEIKDECLYMYDFKSNDLNVCKKIIATTDKSLNLPLIPNSIVEDYHYFKGNINKTIYVEYEEYCQHLKSTTAIQFCSACQFISPDCKRLFVTPNNTILTYTIGEETYSEREVKDLCAKSWDQSLATNKGRSSMDFQNWWKENSKNE